MLYYLLTWLSAHHRTPFLDLLAQQVGSENKLEDVIETAKDYGIDDMVFLGSYRELKGDDEAEDVTVFEWRNESVQALWFPAWEEARVTWPAKRATSDHVLIFTSEGIDIEGYVDPNHPERVNYRERELITWLKANAGLGMLNEEMESILFPPPRERLPMEELEEVIETLELEIERLKTIVRLYGEKREMTLRDRTRSHGVVKRSRARRAARKLREDERVTVDEDC
jgi:hypothetical protein